MNTLQFRSLLWLILTLISLCSAKTCKKICVLSNKNCVTKGGIQIYKSVVYGVKGLLPPLDPLCIDEVEGEKYKLTNITVTGLKNCKVTELVVNPDDSIYEQYLHCPTLSSHFHFKAKEGSDSKGLRGQGIATITVFDYDILNKGGYGVIVDEIAHSPHFFVKTIETKTHLKGKLIFTSTKDCSSDSGTDETEIYMNQNSKETEELLFTPIINKAMKIMMHNIDIYIRKYTMGEVLPEDNLL